MKCEPKVMKHFSTIHTSFAIDFKFTNNITILTGLSAVGKTAAYSFIRECMAVNPKIVCLNYLDYQKNVKEILMQTKDRLIVIDNADILLDDETRKYVEFDRKHFMKNMHKFRHIAGICAYFLVLMADIKIL